MSRDGWAALPRGASGLSVVCDFGISWSYLLTIFFINGPISRVLLLILVHVQPLSCLLFWLLALLRLKTMSLNIAQQFMKEMVKNYFGLLKNQVKFLINWSLEVFLASGLSTYDFSTIYTTLPHNIIKEKLTELIEQTKVHFIWLVMIKIPFLLLNNLNDINCGHVRKCVMLSTIFWTIYL